MEAVALVGRGKKSMWRRIGFWITNIAVLAVIALYITQYAAYGITMKGHSMEPFIAQNSRVYVNRTIYRLVSPERFDVVAFTTEDSDELQIKRIIGMPGEQIKISGGRIYIDGRESVEAGHYIQDITASGIAGETVTLGSDEYFVLGDNPAYSEDSRFGSIGPVSFHQIYGKAWFGFESLLSFRLL